jgi:hypothetical protein
MHEQAIRVRAVVLPRGCRIISRISLVQGALRRHIRAMVDRPKNRTAAHRAPRGERDIYYRGIRIAPIGGRRSPLSRLIRDALRARHEEKHDVAPA